MNPSVVAGANGIFVVAWGATSHERRHDATSVRARRFAPTARR